MVQAEKQKKVFQSLCGQHDYDLLTGKEAMTQADFERITYITTALGYSSCTQELISEHLELACKEAERTDREFDILKDYPEYFKDENVYGQIDEWIEQKNKVVNRDNASVKHRQQSGTRYASLSKKIQRLSDTQVIATTAFLLGVIIFFRSCQKTGIWTELGRIYLLCLSC